MRALAAAVALVLAAFPARAGGPDDWPWAAVGRLTLDGHFICTATLISETVVLTAAHCALDDDGAPYPAASLGFQAGVLGNTAVLVREIAAVRVHPAYAGGFFADMDSTAADVAMLDLAWPVGNHEVRSIPVGTWGGDRRGLLLPSYGEGHEAQLRIDRGCLVDASDGPVLHLTCLPEEGASGAPLVAGAGPERRVVGVLSNSRGGFTPRAFAVRADIALIGMAGLDGTR